MAYFRIEDSCSTLTIVKVEKEKSMNEKKVKPFGLKDKIGYMFGDFGNDFTFMFSSTFLMVFYTKVLGISGAAVGTLFLVARFVDAVTDITMGRIVDKCKPGKDGKFKRWIRIMAGPVALASFLMYQSALADASMAVKYVYMYVTYILWGSICYTGINIPYGSMASAITDVPEERTSLSTFRSIGATLANLIIGVGGPMLVYATDENGAQVIRGGGNIFPILAGIFSVCAILCYIICYKCTTERVKIEKDPNEPKITLADTVKAIFTSRALLGIVAAAIFLLLSSLLLGSINNYLYTDYFGSSRALSTYNLITMVCSLLLATVVGAISKTFGKKESAAATTAFSGIVFLLLGFLHVTNVWVFVVAAAIGYIGVNYFNMVIWANLTDVIDDIEVQARERQDGVVYGVYSFARKIGQALAGGLGGYALTMIAYDEKAVTQTQEVLNGLYNLGTFVPGILFPLVAAMLTFVYPLSKKRVNQNAEILRERRKKQEQGK